MTTYATYEADHYQQAEQLLLHVRNGRPLDARDLIAAAQAEATLAQAAAVTALIDLLRSELAPAV